MQTIFLWIWKSSVLSIWQSCECIEKKKQIIWNWKTISLFSTLKCDVSVKPRRKSSDSQELISLNWRYSSRIHLSWWIFRPCIAFKWSLLTFSTSKLRTYSYSANSSTKTWSHDQLSQIDFTAYLHGASQFDE